VSAAGEDSLGLDAAVDAAIAGDARAAIRALIVANNYLDAEVMETAFTQRRENIIGDCLQLQVDVEVYNDMNPRTKPVQLILDFKDDVAERRAA